MHQRSIRRIRALLLPVLGVAACAITSACGSAGSAGAGAGPSSGGTLTFANYSDLDCFDPQVAQSSFSAIVMGNVYQSLVSETKDGKFAPELAAKWQISGDGTTYTFWLRKGVKFTDGTPFDAQVVKANFDRIVAPSTGSRFAVGLMGPYQDTTVLGPYEVAVHFKTPYSPFLSYAATPYLGFHSQKTLEAAHGKSLCSGAPGTTAGTGPFELTSSTRGQQIVLTRNPGFDSAPATAAHTGPAYLNRIVFKIITDDSVRAGEVSSGELDGADDLAASSLSQLSANPAVKVTNVAISGLGYNYFFNTDNSVLSDQRLRQAIQSAFDVAGTVKAVYDGQYDRAWGPLGPASVGYDPSLKNSYSYDPARAARLLDEAGWTGRDAAGYRTKDGKQLTLKLLYVPEFTTTEVSETDQALQADLKKAGIDLELIPMEEAPYEPVRDAGQYAIIGYSWSAPDPDVLRILYGSQEQFTDGGDNGSRLKDPQVNAWLQQALATTDPAARGRLYDEVQQRLIADADTLPTVDPVDSIALRTGVHGVTFDINGWPQFYDAWVGSK